MGKLAIIADDLSSCTDCGIQIACSGLQTVVAIKPDQDYTRPEEHDVIAVDTDFRSASTVTAYLRSREAAHLVHPYCQSFFQKSIESILIEKLGEKRTELA